MREIDLLLAPFAERQLPLLAADELDAFERLLSSSDQDLQAWLLGRERPHDEAFVDLVERIRQCARRTG